MCKIFRNPTSILKPFYFILVCCTLFFVTPSSGQKRHRSKTKNAQAAPKKVIYGLASFYHNKFHGRTTASGEIFDHNKFTCAYNKIPFGTWLKVTNLRNGKSVEVRVNDRLHRKTRFITDLTSAAAKKLRCKTTGLIKVSVEVIDKKRKA